MRILHTAGTYAPSLDGVAEIVRNISERLVKRGHEVHVATSALPPESPYVELCGVHVHRFSARGNLALGMYGEIEKYRQFVGSGNWGVMINHGLHVWPTDALLHQVGKYRWPSVLVTHGLVDGHPAFREYYAEVPRHVLNYWKWIATSSCSGEESYCSRFNLPKPQVITNGLDVAEWWRPPVRLRELWKVGDTPWVVNVSNHYGNHHKNHPALFELARRLKGHGVRVTQIGNSHRASKWNLGSLGVRGGCFYACRARAMLSGSLELRTNALREHVVSAIQEADVIVSTSRWEANSLVLLESMAAGTPWVSFDVGSARINAGGVVVRDLDEMKEVVVELSRNAELRRKLGNAGRSQILEKHDWDKRVDQYEQIYESAVSQRSGLACV
jgi:glycosyltransferase involved in cell wall biosynthesis